MNVGTSRCSKTDGADVLLGVLIGRSTLGNLVVRSVSSMLGTADRVIFVCANPHSMVVANSDQGFRDALNSASHVVADGVGCQIAGLLTGRDFGPRITGFDYFEALMTRLNDCGGKVFFLGSSTATLARIKQRCLQDYPKILFHGHSPPFGSWTETEDIRIVQLIGEAKPDILWVGLTAPKQEKWVAAHKDRLTVPVTGCIGAVFDYYAGTIRRAPIWLRRIGLEWLYRLVGEPRRLWKRTLVSFPLFIWLVLTERPRRQR